LIIEGLRTTNFIFLASWHGTLGEAHQYWFFKHHANICRADEAKPLSAECEHTSEGVLLFRPTTLGEAHHYWLFKHHANPIVWSKAQRISAVRHVIHITSEWPNDRRTLEMEVEFPRETK
jgi:hypothetical protein